MSKIEKKINIRVIPELEKLRGIRKLTPEGKENYKSWKYFECHYDVRKKVPDAIAGRLDYTRPEPPEDPREIINFGKPLQKQKFPYYTEPFKREMEDIMDDGHIRHPEYMTFIEEEDRRIDEGFWFFNGGTLEYITGYHYMFLQYWLIKVTVKIDGRDKKRTSNPSFRDMHRDIFYAYDIVKMDDRCHGLIFYSFRRAGKTAVALFLGYAETTLYRDQAFTMQSKNEPDGRKLFRKIISSWKKMPKFYKPNDSGDTDPQKELIFSEGKKKLAVKDREYSDAYINSSIEFESSADAALDGLYFSFIFHDEVGKVKTQINVNERWNIAKECISDGTTIIGKAFVTSTIEDMEKYASELAKDLWDRSDTDKVDPIMDRTDSGLYQLFFPAYYGFQGKDGNDKPFVDEWGYTDIRRSHEYMSMMYEFKKGDDLLSFRRKFPMNITDSFALAQGNNAFSKERIYQQKKYNKDMPISPVIVGNFVWTKGVRDTTVEFQPDESGRWEVSWVPLKEDRSKYEMRGGQRSPTRFFARTGCDPFNQSFTRGKGSLAAATTTVRNYFKKPEANNGIVCTYLHRQQYSEDFFEDMILQSVFYSSLFLAESNKDGVLEHFRKRGYNGFAMRDPLERDPKKRANPARGVPMSSDAKRNAMVDSIQSFIYDHIGLDEESKEYGWCPHNGVLDEWLKFDAANWRVYDLTVSTGMSLLAWLEAPRVKSEPKDISAYFNVPNRKK